MAADQQPCPYCQMSIPADAYFCRHCQASLDRSSPTQRTFTPTTRKAEWYCPQCGYVGSRRSYTKGSFGLEALLWLLMIVPGLVYSLWRLSSRYAGCPRCQSPSMIPVDSPKAQEILSRTR